MQPSSTELVILQAHVQIRALLENYFSSIDQPDPALLNACFTEDAVAVYHAGTAAEVTTRTGAAIAAGLLRAIVPNVNSNHGVSNITIRINGDRASSTTFAVVQINRGERIFVRGLRYDDDLVKQGEAWRIALRRHTPLWQHEVASTALGMPTR